MGLGTSRNRRRADARERRENLRGAAARHAPWVARALAGLLRASEAELLKLANLSAGQNLFALDASAAERAMASHPWVKSVRITRRFPGGLSVEVEERAPHALVVLGSLYLLDGDGQPFRRAQPGDALDPPLVTGVDRDAYAQDPAAATARIAGALDVADRYSRAPESRRARLSEVRLEPDGGLTLVTAPGQEVRLGEGDYEAKLSRLWRVRDELQARAMAADLIHLENRVRPASVAVRISGQVSERSPAR